MTTTTTLCRRRRGDGGENSAYGKKRALKRVIERSQHVGVPLFNARQHEIQGPLHPAVPTASISTVAI
ncbi:hypothetical protein QJS10_CPA08g00967 [Acorus calamus]|uniref:Uncharacterized protein n=1 Tax=Acorus calamus TaxID=4465 RepID=A0AAV9EAL3_ACOCL|nr:hypothetical protein QJS10_CPA08g00967 [Acorus calamus]